MAWIYLVIAGLFEVVWAVGLKYSQGFSKLWPSIITCVGMLVSIVLLAQALKNLPVGTAYAVWTGIGALGTVLVGIVVLGEPSNWARLVFMGFILIGIIGLKATAA